ncbi:carbohydrate kinase [Deinococcus sonorensis]|uniref:Carbohydrate kinase n=2 Tax=Deinococcus sonorensis TaxID=309891 RepID=A0AAU7UGI2_9DEIO
MTRVLAFGGAVIDLVPAGGDHWQARAGGSAWTVARCLARLGLSAPFVGALSDDPFGQRLAAEGQAAGLDLSFVQRVSAPTALAVIHRAHPALYAFYAAQAADSQFGDVPPAAWDGARAAYFGGITLVREPARAAFLQQAQTARARGLTVVYDPNYRAQLAEAYREAFVAYLPLTDVLKVSEEDLGGLLPDLGTDQALAHIRSIHPAVTVLLTLGSAGARLLGPDLDLHHPGYPVKVADTVGAGDASIAALLSVRLQHPEWPARRQLGFALAAAAAACTVAGAHAPSHSDVLQIMQDPQG